LLPTDGVAVTELLVVEKTLNGAAPSW